MNTLNIECWCKPEGAEKSVPIGLVTFTVSPDMHLKLAAAEDELAEDELNDKTQTLELDIDVEVDGLELQTPEECGALKDCKFHVYRHPHDNRGHFFLVGHRVSDNALVYSNAVVIDQLG